VTALWFFCGAVAGFLGAVVLSLAVLRRPRGWTEQYGLSRTKVLLFEEPERKFVALWLNHNIFGEGKTKEDAFGDLCKQVGNATRDNTDDDPFGGKPRASQGYWDRWEACGELLPSTGMVGLLAFMTFDVRIEYPKCKDWPIETLWFSNKSTLCVLGEDECDVQSSEVECYWLFNKWTQQESA